MLRLNTIDKLILSLGLCLTCLPWTGNSTASEALPFTVDTVSLMQVQLAMMSVWQQYGEERFDREAFHNQLLTYRGDLVRLCTEIFRQGSPEDLRMNLKLLYRARLCEDVSL